MTGHDRAAVCRHRTLLLAVACIGGTLVLSGCTGFRQVLGMDRVGPDEFAVESRAPLTIPPEYELRPPQPGAPRPQEITSADKARRVIDSAGPGEPGRQATVGLKVPQGGIAGSGPQLDPTQQVGEQSLAGKLLGTTDNAPAGATERRETQPLKGVY